MSRGHVATLIANNTQAKSPRNTLARIAEQKLFELQSKKMQINSDRLVDFIPLLSPELVRPTHLEKFCDILEDACRKGGLRYVIAAPPQHGKSQTVLHALVWLAIKFPGKKHAYVTYSTERTEYVSGQFQELAALAGLEPIGRLSDVRLKGGTEVRFTSVGGSLTGFPVTGMLVIDDPIKDRADSESPTLRRRAYEWFTSTARTRRHKSTSIICMATRWHPEDLSGLLIKPTKDRPGYPYLNFKAIAEGPVDPATGIVIGDPNNRKPGEALFPEFKDAEFFTEEKENDYDWNSLYQGEPRGRGNTVFQWPDLGSAATYYTPLHVGEYERISVGIDFAYTKKTSADYSTAVVLGEYKGDIHVIETIRMQVEPREFRDRIRLLAATYPKAAMSTYISATEKGGVEFFRDGGLDRIDGIVAKADKFMRAIPTAAAWNSGRFKLPPKADWLVTFVDEVCNFTGAPGGGNHDDLTDAMASAFDGFGPPPATYRPQIHSRIVGDYAEIGFG